MNKISVPFRGAVVALVLAALMSVSGCGQDSGAPGGTVPAPSAEAPSANHTELIITLAQKPGAEVQTFVLVADGTTAGADSTVPDPAAAIAALEARGEEIFFPVSAPPESCTEQYGGPQVATVDGWFRGRAVKAEFSRTNGCEIDRWAAMEPLLGGAAALS